MDDTVSGAPTSAASEVDSAVAGLLLPSQRLTRLAKLTASDLQHATDNGGAAPPQVCGPRELSEQELADVLVVVDASTAPATKAAYGSDWARFTGWATERRLAPLPAPPLVVAHYVTEAAAEQTGVGKWRYTPATLTRWVSSINQFHTAAGLDAPGRSEVVRRALSGVRRIRATPPTRKAPLLLDDVRTLLRHLAGVAGDWPAGVAARRDAALLVMGFAGAYRRGELTVLTLEDVVLHRSDGLHVWSRRSKTDQDAHGVVKALPYGRDPATCPPCAYVRWREVLHAFDAAPDDDPRTRRRAVMRVLRRQDALTPPTGNGGGGEDPAEDRELLHVCRTTRLPDAGHPERVLFPSVHKTGAIGEKAMTGHAVNEMIKRRAAQAGFTPNQIAALGGHSLAVRVRHRGVPAGGGRALDHATDRAPRARDARGLRPRTRPPGRERRHPPRPVSDRVTQEQLSPRHPSDAEAASVPTGYAATWALFADWCDVTGNTPLPADPEVVTAFLAGCPASRATQRRRVTAIDHHHTATGYPRPGDDPAVLAALGRTVPEPAPPPEKVAAVDHALRMLPSHGWTHGVFGRRDRCLLVLSQLANVPYRHLAALTVGDIAFTGDGTARITAASGSWTLRPVGDPVVCGSCAVARWMDVLDVVATRISTSAVADHLGHADPVTAESPHVCRSALTLDAATSAVPLLPPINQWGAMPFPHPQLTPHATSLHARNLLAGEVVIHRTLPFPGDGPLAAESPAALAEQMPAAFGKDDADRAWIKRRNDLQRLGNVGQVLSDVDRQIAELQQRVTDLLNAEID